MSGIIADNAGRHTGLVKAASAGGVWNLIKTLTASASGTLDFVDGASDVVLDSTYDEYVFKFYDIHPSADGENFTVGFRDGSTAYDATKTTAYFTVYHDEADTSTNLGYDGTHDLAQSTDFQRLQTNSGTDNDQSCSGYLHLFNPSSTTFVKHFISMINTYHSSDYSLQTPVAGYCNVTAAIDAVQFKMSSGNIDTGQISLYGIT